MKDPGSDPLRTPSLLTAATDRLVARLGGMLSLIGCVFKNTRGNHCGSTYSGTVPTCTSNYQYSNQQQLGENWFIGKIGMVYIGGYTGEHYR